MTTITFPAAGPIRRANRFTMLHRVIGTLGDWRRRSAERAALAQMSAHQLRDIGLTRASALVEVQKAPWHV